MSVRAGIVVTGTEVLTGRVTDRNGPWVSERLGELGCEQSLWHVALYHLPPWAVAALGIALLSRWVKPKSYAP